MPDLLDWVFSGKNVVRKIGLIVAIGVALLWGGSYLGIAKVSGSPSAPNFEVVVGIVKPPDSTPIRQVLPQEWFSHEVGRWPGASFHVIDDNGACAAHAQDGPAIVYKATWKAHLTAFRMVRFLQPGVFQPGSPQAPVSQPSTPELERDCGAAYDLIVFPFGILDRARFN